MAKIAAQSGNGTADLTPELAEELCIAIGGEASTRGFASGALGRHSHKETQLEADRLSPTPAASPMPAVSAFPAASPNPPASSMPEAWPRSEAPR